MNNNHNLKLLLSIEQTNSEGSVIVEQTPKENVKLNLVGVGGLHQNISKKDFYFLDFSGKYPQLVGFNTHNNQLTPITTLENVYQAPKTEYYQVGDTFFGIGYDNDGIGYIQLDKNMNPIRVKDNSKIEFTVATPNHRKDITIQLTPTKFDTTIDDLLDQLEDRNEYEKAKQLLKQTDKITYEYSFITKVSAFSEENGSYLFVSSRIDPIYYISTEDDRVIFKQPKKVVGKVVYISKSGEVKTIDEVEFPTDKYKLLHLDFYTKGGQQIYGWVYPYSDNKVVGVVGGLTTTDKYKIEIDNLKGNTLNQTNLKVKNNGIIFSLDKGEFGVVYDERLGVSPTLVASQYIKDVELNGNGGYIQLGKNLKFQLPHPMIEWDYLIALGKNNKPTKIEVGDTPNQVKKVSNGTLLSKEFFNDLKKVIADKLGVKLSSTTHLLAYNKFVYFVDTDKKLVKVGRITPDFTKSDLKKPFSGYHYDDKLKVEPIAKINLTENETLIPFSDIEDLAVQHSDKGNPYLVMLEKWDTEKRIHIFKIDKKTGKLEHKLSLKGISSYTEVGNITLHEVGDTLTAIVSSNNGNSVWVGDNSQPPLRLYIELHENVRNDVFTPNLHKEMFEVVKQLKSIKEDKEGFFHIGATTVYVKDGIPQNIYDKLVEVNAEFDFPEYAEYINNRYLCVYNGMFNQLTLWKDDNKYFTLNIC